MKRMYTRIVPIFLATTLVSLAYADNRSEFEAWMSKEKQSYQEYRDKRDQEFTGFLKAQWKEMQTFSGLVRDKTPKPVHMPVAPPPPPAPAPQPQVKPQPQPKPVPDVVTQPEVKPVPVPPPAPEIKPPPVVVVPPIVTVPKPVPVPSTPVVKTPAGKTLSLHFYGQNISISYDPALRVSLKRPVNGESISGYWSDMSRAKYEPLLRQLNEQKSKLQLDDWGYAVLVNDISTSINRNSASETALFNWFVLTKAGYNARIAYDSGATYLLMPTQQKLYGTSYFTFDNRRYYAVSFDGKKQKLGRIYTYDGQYPDANRLLDMRIRHSLNTIRSDRKKVVAFEYGNRTYRINLDYDEETIKYLQTYPQMDIALYFSANVNPATAHPLLSQLKPLVQGRSEEDAVNLLLRFVQTAFKYKTDEAQFGYENYLFPEETMRYPYSDCEDRSVLFAWLVRSLLGLEVVGLDYPGHIATAVHFTKPVNGDGFMFQGKRFVITDPTYINANAGMTMPNYKTTKPGVITI